MVIQKFDVRLEAVRCDLFDEIKQIAVILDADVDFFRDISDMIGHHHFKYLNYTFWIFVNINFLINFHIDVS